MSGSRRRRLCRRASKRSLLRVKFYAVQIAQAIQYLHLGGVAHRDLKPENVLIDEQGYTKLCDFGFAKCLKDGRTFTYCGTAAYMAPEIIRGLGHDKSVDWWSFGILLYEMLIGFPPFYDNNIERVLELICFGELYFPPDAGISKDARDLISQCLVRNPSRRIGYKSGFMEISKHAFFWGVDIEAIKNRKAAAPFVPSVKDKYDCAYFQEESPAEIALSPLKEGVLSEIKANSDIFSDF